jgi:hypothetical protein
VGLILWFLRWRRRRLHLQLMEEQRRNLDMEVARVTLAMHRQLQPAPGVPFAMSNPMAVVPHGYMLVPVGSVVAGGECARLRGPWWVGRGYARRVCARSRACKRVVGVCVSRMRSALSHLHCLFVARGAPRAVVVAGFVPQVQPPNPQQFSEFLHAVGLLRGADTSALILAALGALSLIPADKYVGIGAALRVRVGPPVVLGWGGGAVGKGLGAGVPVQKALKKEPTRTDHSPSTRKPPAPAASVCGCASAPIFCVKSVPGDCALVRESVRSGSGPYSLRSLGGLCVVFLHCARGGWGWGVWPQQLQGGGV